MDDNKNLEGYIKETESMLEQLFDRIPEDQRMTDEDLNFEDFLDGIFGKEETEEK